MFLAVSAAEELGEESSERGGRTAPGGWYPDPHGSGNLLYWDGSRWTGDVHDPNSRPVRRGKSRERSDLAVIGGACALAISPFLTWVKVILLGNLSLFQLLEAAGSSNGLAWGAVLAAGTAAAVAFKARSSAVVRGTGLTVGLLGGALSLYALVGLREELKDAHGLAAVGIGPYVAVAGCLAMVVGALMSKRDPASAL